MQRKLKKLLGVLFIVVALACVMAVSASAETYSGECGNNGDNVTWTLDTETGELVISGDGAIKDYTNNAHGLSPFYKESYIKSVIIKDGITRIGNCTFDDCTNLVNVTIPDSVTSIGHSAFSDCTSLASITIPDSVTDIGGRAFFNTAYYNNSSNWEDNIALYIDNCLIQIKSRHYGNYSIKPGTRLIAASDSAGSFTSIEIPDSVIYINSRSSISGSNLTKIIVDKNNEFFSSDEQGVLFNKDKTVLLYYPDGKSEKTYTVPDGVIIIQGFGLWSNNSVENIVIPDSVTTISDNAFAYANLKNVTIGNGLFKIGDYAFKECDNLESITIGSGLVEIGDYAFNCSNLSNLESVTIKSNHKLKIGAAAFAGCSKLNITTNNVIDFVGPSAFSGCENLKNVYLDDGLVNIPANAFCCCKSLESIIIPDSVTSIGVSAFEGCTSITSIAIPDSVTSIGGYTFKGCTSIRSVEIPDNVTYIASAAFRDCKSLEFLTIPASAKYINYDSLNSTFSGVVSLKSVFITKGTGIMANNYNVNHSDQYIPWKMSQCDEITITLENGITNIPYRAFSGTNITSMVIPDSVTSIDVQAFEYCKQLTNLTIPASAELATGFSYSDVPFYACNSIKNIHITKGNGMMVSYPTKYKSTPWGVSKAERISITLEDGIQNISERAFYETEQLVNIVIPNSITTIGDYAFVKCTSLTNITIPNSVITIGKSAFWGCTGLTSITIPESVTSIGNFAFYNCTGLSSITIPESVTSIGDSVFYNCTGLSSITIPESVTSIGDSAFYGCSSLTSITIGKGLTSIGEKAFYNTSIKNVYITDIVHWCNIAFPGVASNPLCYGADLYLSGELVTDLIIPDSVTTIAHWAFAGCRSLASIIIPESMASIGDSVFFNCTGLSSIIIPEGLTTIGYKAFYGCENLNKIVLPNSVTSLGSDVFDETSNRLIIHYTGSREDADKLTELRYYPIHTDCEYKEVTSGNLKEKAVACPSCCWITGEISKNINGHDYTEYQPNNDASCTKDGTETCYCKNGCGTEKTRTMYGSRTGHSFTNYVSNENATCTKNGTKTAWCDNNCGLTDTVTDYGSATGHSYEEVIYNPTCTENGYIEYTCHCGRHYTETIEATGHDFEGSKCKNCPFDRATECSCNCHAGGIKTFFFSIINFFQKLFGQNKICTCGANH